MYSPLSVRVVVEGVLWYVASQTENHLHRLKPRELVVPNRPGIFSSNHTSWD